MDSATPRPFPGHGARQTLTDRQGQRSAGFILQGAGLAEGNSLLDAMTDGNRLTDVLDNWVEVAEHMIVLLRTEGRISAAIRCSTRRSSD